MVRVVVSGNQVPVSIEVTEAAMKLSPEELSERLTKAAREAHASSVSAMQSKMKELAGKLGLPGLPGGGAAPGM